MPVQTPAALTHVDTFLGPQYNPFLECPPQMGNIYDERCGDIPDKLLNVPAQVSSPLIYHHMFIQAADHVIMSVLRTCAYLARLSFEVKCIDTSQVVFEKGSKRSGALEQSADDCVYEQVSKHST